MSKRNISGSSISMNREINVTGKNVITHGTVRNTYPPLTAPAPDHSKAFSTMLPSLMGAVPVSTGISSAGLSLAMTAVAAVCSAGNVNISPNPTGPGFLATYANVLQYVTNGAYAKKGTLNKAELKKLIMALITQILGKAGPGFSGWNQILLCDMQNVTLMNFLKGVQDFCALIKDPVNANTGNFIYEREDLSIKGKIPLLFKRTYNRIDKRVGSMGIGWRHNYEIELLIQLDSCTIIWEDGREEIYFRDDRDELISLFGCLSRLKKNEDVYQYHSQAGFCYTFDGAGRLNSKVDANGNEVHFTYNNKGRLERATSNYGSALYYKYDSTTGNLLSAQDQTGRVVGLSYDLKHLVKVSNPMGETYVYGYGNDGTIYRIKNSRGVFVVENGYDCKGRTINQKFADGGQVLYDYQENGSRTLVTEQNKNKIAYYHDERFRNVKTVFEDGEENFLYNTRNQVTQYTDKKGNKIKYSYDDKGNRTQIIYPDGSKHSMTYDANNRLLVLSINGVLKRKNYFDFKGNLLKTEDGLGRYRKFEYGDYGQITKITQADGSFSLIQYDQRGNITKIIDESGNKVQYFYDACNRVIKAIDRNGNPINYEYDACNRIICVVNAENNRRSYKYTKNGKVEKIIDYNGAVTVQSYNLMNRVKNILLPDGGEIHLSYDHMQNVSGQIDPNGVETRFQYDMLNHLNQVTLPNSGTIQYKYDANGNCTSSRDANGCPTKLEYDERNRVVAVTDPANARIEYQYDLFGNLAAITNAYGKSQTFVYNEADQIVSKTDITGNTICYEYNELGKLSCVIDPMKRRTIYDYYPGGTLEKISYPNGHFERFRYDNNKNIIRRENQKGDFLDFNYDCMDRIVGIQSGFGQENSYTYDALGNVTSIKDTLGNVTSYTYSLGGRLTSVLDAVGHRTEYAYNAAGKLVTICQHEGSEKLLENSMKMPLHSDGLSARKIHITQYKRDILGEIEAVRDPLGLEEGYAYDMMGNMVLKKDKEGYETRYEYTPRGDISRIVYADGRSVYFSYNPLRQLVQVHDWLGTTHIELDDAGRTRKVTDHKGREAAYQWGKMGQREAILYPDGRKVSYEYDELSRLSRLTDEDREIQYLYNEDGRLSEKCFSDGFSTRQEYNQKGLLSSLTHRKNEELLDQYLFEYDNAGNKTGIKKKRTSGSIPLLVDQRSKLQEENGYYQYQYDCLNRLAEVKKDRKLLNRYTFDAFGNRSKQETESEHIHYYYNEANQLIRREGIFPEETYQYDARGNLITILQGKEAVYQYVYDETNRLSETNSSKGRAAKYQYNGLGNRTGVLEYGSMGPEAGMADGHQSRETLFENPVKEVDYLLDLTKQHHNLLEKTESRQGNTASERYTWDTNVVFMVKDDHSHVYLQDELGSPVRLVEVEEKKQTIYGYDVFGGDLYGNKGVVQPFGFNGYEKDHVGNTYFAQAREYFPVTGRFGAEDCYKGKLNYPLTINQYEYCWGNPLILSDYSGKSPAVTTGSPDAMTIVVDWATGKIEAAAGLIEEAREVYDNQRVTVPAPAFPERNTNMPDYTDVINNWLYSKEAEFSSTKFWWGSAGFLKPFYDQVKTGGPMDIKDKTNWYHAFGDDTPYTSYFIYNGEVMDPGTLGNITYGYIGTYIGYSDEILYYGGGYANMKVPGEKYIPATPFMQNYGDSPEDIIAIKKGTDLFNSQHSRYLHQCEHSI